MSTSSKEVNDAIKSSKQLASYTMIIQLMYRVFTFLSKSMLFRYVSAETVGVVNVTLTLLYDTILFLSREAFRRACLSGNEKSQAKWKKLINLLWCVFPLGLVVGSASVLLWTYVWPKPENMADYDQAVVVFALCACAELAIEPLQVIGQSFGMVKLKVLSEGLSLTTKCALTLLLVINKPDLQLWCFCIAQISHSVIMVVSYILYFAYLTKSGSYKKFDLPFTSMRDFLPSIKIKDYQDLASSNYLMLTWSFFKQSASKNLLTKGANYVMTMFGMLSFAEQGIFDTVTNIGALAARFLFLPIEDSFYVFFAKMLNRNKTAKEHEKSNMVEISKVLYSLLRLVVIIGVLIISFGMPYSFLLLDLYGGHKLTDGNGPLLLRFYCFYVLFLALNGITECFANASRNQHKIDNHSTLMSLLVVVFVVMSLILSSVWGGVGFILADCINMLCRTKFSIDHIISFYEDFDTNPHPLKGILPSRQVVVAMAASLITCCISSQYLSSYFVVFRIPMLHVSVGALCLLFVLSSVYFYEKILIQFLSAHFVSKKSK